MKKKESIFVGSKTSAKKIQEILDSNGVDNFKVIPVSIVSAFRHYIESSNDGIAILKNNKILTANTQLCRMSGYSLNEIKKIPFSKLVQKSNKTEVLGEEEPLVEYESPIFEAIVLSNGDGHTHVDLSLFPIDYYGKIAEIAHLRDITPRKLAEAEVKRLYRAILQSSNMVIITDKDGKIEYANPRFLAATGYTKDEVIGKSPSFLKSDFHPNDVYKRLWETLNSGRVWRGQFYNKKKNGEFFWEMATISPIKDVMHEVTHFVKVSEDITGMKQSEDQLRKAKTEAEKANYTKTMFLSNISHEIRTPLNSIIGMADILSETNLDPEQKKYLSISQKSGETLLELINDLLDLSKIESGRLDLENIPFNLANLTQDSVDKFKIISLSKGITIDSKVKEGLPSFVSGDPTRITQILTNLLSNALKFTEKGNVKLRVKTFEAGQKEKKLLFSVSDSGIGIHHQNKENIFKSFTQSDSSTTRKYGGTGLGLAISKNLVELMGGNIWFQSTHSIGSTFYFTLPYKEEVESLIKPPINKSLEISNEDIDNNAKRILFAEDSTDNVILVTAFLKRTNHILDHAHNGEIALNKFKENTYDLVLMDIQMPVMDGLTAVKKIRLWESENNKTATPILALTAHAFKEEEAKSFEAGCNAHLTKPLRKQVLLENIKKFTKSKTTESTEIINITADPDLAEIIPGFLKNRKTDVIELKKRVELSDSEKLRAIGHRLKGDGLAYGFAEISRIGAEIEIIAKESNIQGISKLVDELESYLNRLNIIY